MTRSAPNQSLSLSSAAAVLLSLFTWLILGLFTLSISLHALLLTSIGALMLFGRLKGSARNLSDDWRPYGFVHAERNRREFAVLRAQSTQARVVRSRNSRPLRSNV